MKPQTVDSCLPSSSVPLLAKLALVEARPKAPVLTYDHRSESSQPRIDAFALTGSFVTNTTEDPTSDEMSDR